MYHIPFFPPPPQFLQLCRLAQIVLTYVNESYSYKISSSDRKDTTELTVSFHGLRHEQWEKRQIRLE